MLKKISPNYHTFNHLIYTIHRYLYSTGSVSKDFVIDMCKRYSFNPDFILSWLDEAPAIQKVGDRYYLLIKRGDEDGNANTTT